MHNFQFFLSEDRNYPREIKLPDGNIYAINANFKAILQIMYTGTLKHYPEEARLLEQLGIFYGKDSGPADLMLAQKAMKFFIAKNDPFEDDGQPPTFSFVHDADAVKADILRQYHFDPYRTDKFIHWFEFLELVENLVGETAISKRIQERTADITHLKGKDFKRARDRQLKLALPKG